MEGQPKPAMSVSHRASSSIPSVSAQRGTPSTMEPANEFSAAKQASILLPGFDRRKQLDHIDFKHVSFSTCWLRRTFTNESARHIHLRVRWDDFNTRDVRLQDVRYGNNMAVLFKVCNDLSDYYGCRDFWVAIGREFGASGEATRAMVDILSDARHCYREGNPNSDVATGVTAAVDKWLYFQPNRNSLMSRTTWEPDSDLFNVAHKRFREYQNKMTDMGGMLPKEITPNPTIPRKRSPSPMPPGTAPSPKRKPSPSMAHRRDSFHESSPQSLPPLSTGLSIRGQAARPDSLEYKTPISAHDAAVAGDHFSNRTPEPFSEQRIRGIAQRDVKVSSSDLRRPADNLSLANENEFLREQVKALELEKKLALDERVKQMESTYADFEKRLAASEKRFQLLKEIGIRQTQELESAQATIKSLKSSQDTMRESLQQNQDNWETQQKEMKDKLASHEAKLADNATSPATDTLLQNMQPRLEFLEAEFAKITEDMPKAKGNSNSWSAEILHIKKRVDCIEEKPDEGETLRELESRIQTLEHRHEKLPSAADNAVTISKLQEASEQADSRMTNLEQIVADTRRTVATKSPILAQDIPEFTEIKDKVSILETRADEAFKLCQDVFKTSSLKQQAHTDCLCKSNEARFATIPFVSDKVFKLENNVRKELAENGRNTEERLRNITKDIENARAQNKGLSTVVNKMTAANALQRKAFISLQSEVSSISNGVDAISQNQLQKQQLDELKNKITELSCQVAAVKDNNEAAADLKKQMQALQSCIYAIQEEKQSDTKLDLHYEIDYIRECIGLLIKHIKEMFTMLGK